VALYIQGDLRTSGALTITVDPGAELDLFVGGSLQGNGTTLGDPARAAATRVYVAGQTSFLGALALGANLYAPASTFTALGQLSVSGSIFAGTVTATGPLAIHYDQAILGVAGCEAPPASCASCHDCPGAAPACNGGACGACMSDSDCCAPLVCQAGACVSEGAP
jgi:hypothetical protein